MQADQSYSFQPQTNFSKNSEQKNNEKMEEKQCEEDSQDQEYFNQDDFGDQLYCVPQKQMNQDPYRLIGPLIFKSKSSSTLIRKGTGILISRNLVLTCSHNILQKKTKLGTTQDISEEFQDWRFYPGHRGLLNLNQGYQVQSVFYPPQYKDRPNSARFQYALMKLKDKVGNIKQKSFIPLKEVSQLDEVKEIAIFGYPGKENNYIVKDAYKKTYEVFQYGLIMPNGINVKSINQIVRLNHKKSRIEHRMSTFEGQSGSPIIAIHDEGFSIIGIHKGGCQSKNEKFNVGRLMTETIVKQLKKTALEWGAEMFRIYKVSHLSLQWFRQLKMLDDSSVVQNQGFYLVPPKQMKKIPHQLIGMISFEKESGEKGRGTGILLSSNLVLTAGHHIYDRKSQEKWKNLSFNPGFSSENPQKLYNIEKVYVNDQFFFNQGASYDYGLLKLSSKVPIADFVPIKADASFQQLNQNLAIFGYSIEQL